MMAAGSYQRMPFQGGRIALVALLLGCAVSPAEAGDGKYDRARAAHPDLFEVYYEEMVLDYCGLLTPEAEAGFRLVRDELLAADPLAAETHREVRVASGIAADYAYQDHGLSGQKQWCRTEGLSAYNRFVTRSRARDPGASGQIQLDQVR